jgi:hypothetical protein
MIEQYPMKLMEHKNKLLSLRFNELVERTIRSFEGKDLASIDKRLLKGILERKSYNDKKKDTMMDAMKNVLLGGLTGEDNKKEDGNTKPQAKGGFGAMLNKYKVEATSHDKANTDLLPQIKASS